MPTIRSITDLTFRVLMNPGPRTQSESNAVFQVLRDYGPIHTFKLHHHLPVKNLDGHQDKAQTGISASVIFSRATKAVYDLRDEKSVHRFTVVANADIPDPALKDPYNVRGLQSRKPELEPREIECCIIPVEEEEDGAEHPVLEALKTNPYSGAFAVDRGSIFAEILARTDCPSGLIHGLLPKLNDEHRIAAFDQGLVKKDTAETGPNAEFPTLYFGKLDLTETDDSQSTEATAAQKEDPNVDGNASNEVNFHDEFADLRGVSLMQMYRDGLDADGSQKDATLSTFLPFSNKPRIE